MRGKVRGIDENNFIRGITPAYAGKSCEWAEFATTEEDHPRLCGEKRQELRKNPLIQGSPPPMRGKVIHTLVRITVYRITPAYAGKSSRYGLFCAENKDHPRLCGEKPSQTAASRYKPGSPPPMRGKVWWSSQTCLWQGITPAYAGKSLAEFGKTSKAWDHPRLCGEKSTKFTK